MSDQSYLDKKYFVSPYVYNCPFCNRNNITYDLPQSYRFDWTDKKKCYVYFAQCSSCKNTSMHLSYESFVNGDASYRNLRFKDGIEIDSKIFYSVPTSFFTLDNRIHEIIRELITEAEGCLKMNFLTGASVCMRKAIYELLVLEKAEGDDYESRIKYLKNKYPEADPSYFDILSHIQGMTSDKIHEQSWDKWDSKNLKLIIETLRNVLIDIYVIPAEKKERVLRIEKLREGLVKDQKGKQEPTK